MKKLLLVVALAMPLAAQVQIGTGVQIGGSSSSVGLPTPTYYAYDSASLATALSACYSYVNANSVSASIQIGPGNYTLSSQFTEPPVSGAGCNLYGSGLATTNIYMAVQGSPVEAMIYRAGGTAGNRGVFSLRNFSLYCTDQATTSINALYGLQLVAMAGGSDIQNVLVSNCGSQALGGEDILIGGSSVAGEVVEYTYNISTNYNEGFYTGPAGGGGPTPPNNGVEIGVGTGDGYYDKIITRNAQNCGINVTGGASVVLGGHAFGYAASGSVPYAPNYAFCDNSTFGGSEWINMYSDGPRISGFYINTTSGGSAFAPNVSIVNPLFLWPSVSTGYPTSPYPNLMTLNTDSFVNVDSPNCTNKFYTTNAGMFTLNSGASAVVPNIYGGTNCMFQWETGAFNSYSILNFVNDGLDNNIGSNALATNHLGLSGHRAQYGYVSGVGAVTQSSNSIGGFGWYYNSSTYGSGTYLAYLDATNGLKIGGSSPFGSNWNQAFGVSGINSQKLQTGIAAASTIAPVGPITNITGTGTIATITPPSDCPATNLACSITLISANGFSTTTGGNIQSAMTTTQGETLTLIYMPNLSLWYAPFAASTSIGGALSGSNIALGASAGTGASVTVTGNDSTHQVALTTGTSTTSGGILWTMTFTQSLGRNRYCILQLYNSTALTAGQQPVLNTAAASTYVVDAGGTALTASSTYTWNVSCP